MPLVCLTTEYLFAQHSGKDGLQLDHLRHILRIYLNVPKLKPTPKSYHDAVQQIVDKNVAVDWNWIINSVGTPSSLDQKFKELLDKEIITAPEQPEPASSPLTEPDNIPSPTKSTRAPTPLPANACLELITTEEELKKDRSLLWEFLQFDQEADLKPYDPKFVVVNLTGKDQVVIHRYNAIDLNDLIKYNGLLRPTSDVGDPMEDADGDTDHSLEDYDPAGLITVGVRTREAVDRVVFQEEKDGVVTPPGYAVSWGFPGIANAGLFLLVTCKPNMEPIWELDVTETHVLAATGSPNALRIVLYINSLPEYNWVAEYLREQHAENSVIQAIVATNSNAKEKTKGRTPACWKLWACTVAELVKAQTRVPGSHPTEAARKLINRTHWGVVLKARPDWVTKVVETGTLINARATETAVKVFLDNTTKNYGIEKFHTLLTEL